MNVEVLMSFKPLHQLESSNVRDKIAIIKLFLICIIDIYWLVYFGQESDRGWRLICWRPYRYSCLY